MERDVAAKVDLFFSHYPLKKVKRGQIIVYGGEEPGVVFYLLSGNVRQYDITDRGDEIVVNVFKPPAFFSMSWAINRSKNPYFFEAVTPVEMRQAPPDEVVDFLQKNPDVMYDLLRRLYSGVDGLQRRMAHLMGGSARSRMLFELSIECRRFGKIQKDKTYLLSINESELAKHAGLARETANRELRKLKSEGLISYSNGLIVKDLAKIENELGSNL